METNQLLQADVLDIIFEHRNKAYGAYELRKTYNKRLKTAVSIMIICCLLAFLITVAGKSKNYQPTLTVDNIVNLESISQPEQPPVPPPPPPPPPVQQQIATRQFATIQLVDETPQTPPPVQSDLDNIAIGISDNPDGIIKDVVAPPVDQAIIERTPQVIEDYTKEFKTVQVEARFPGGQDVWKKFLERNLRAETPLDNGAPAGIYSVTVSFLVDKEGNISEVKALNDPGYGTADEAVRTIQKGPKWIPALQNGRNVIYRQKQVITFQVRDEQ